MEHIPHSQERIQNRYLHFDALWQSKLDCKHSPGQEVEHDPPLSNFEFCSFGLPIAYTLDK